MERATSAAGAGSWSAPRGLPCSLGEHAVEHLHDELLLGLGQACEALDLLLQLRRRAALGRGGLLADQPSRLTPSARASVGSADTGTRRWPIS